MFYFNRKSSSERVFGFDPEDEDVFFQVNHGKLDERRQLRFKKRLQVESARRQLQKLVASDDYRHLPRGGKRFRLEQLRVISRKSK